MTHKNDDILKHLLNIYKELYSAKGIFKSSYFKYSIDEVESAVKEATIVDSKEETKKALNIRDEISNIKSEEEAKRFYVEFLKYNKEEEESKIECLKKVTLDELKHLYTLLYASQTKSKITKEELLSLIEKYFNGIERALSMKP